MSLIKELLQKLFTWKRITFAVVLLIGSCFQAATNGYACFVSFIFTVLALFMVEALFSPNRHAKPASTRMLTPAERRKHRYFD